MIKNFIRFQKFQNDKIFKTFQKFQIIILKNDKTIVAYHFGQYYGLLQKE